MPLLHNAQKRHAAWHKLSNCFLSVLDYSSRVQLEVQEFKLMYVELTAREHV
jgi:hypothetical protein